MPRKKAEESIKGKLAKKTVGVQAKKKVVEKTEKKDEKIEKKKEEQKSEETLLPVEEYIKAGVHLGTKVITPHLRKYVYKRRADGLAVLNTNIIDEKLREAAEFLAGFEPENAIIVCKREAGWEAVELFSQLTGIRAFTKKYPAGIITNIRLPDFFEVDLIIICDPWIDKNALKDANMTNKKVLALCDTNNYAFGVDVFVPCNNKSGKSLGTILYILTREYLKKRKVNKKLPKIEEFIGEEIEKKEEKIDKKELEKEKKKIERKLK